MENLRVLGHTLRQFPEYGPAAGAALAVLVTAVPIYFALWYFLHRRESSFPLRLQIAFLGVFVMFAGLAFLVASPLANQIHFILTAYLFITCVMAAYCLVALMDIFFIQHYLVRMKGVYISPPLQKVISFLAFCLTLLPILHYVLQFNPFTLVAIPTIATAGIALAFQDTIKAFIAGVGLGQLVRMGDWVAFQDKEGRVVDINWGRVALRTGDGALLFVPNTLLRTQAFVNLSANRAHRLTLKIALSYRTDPERVKKALARAVENISGVNAYPEPVAQLVLFDTPAVMYALYYWIEDYANRLEIQDKVASHVWKEINKEGFEVPFPFPVYSLKADVNKGRSLPAKPASTR
jgi:small-conductance mechanosensitive channel